MTSTPGAVLLSNAMILDGTGSAAFAGEIEIDGGRIVDVRPEVSPDRERSAIRRLDCAGRTVMPGLVEAHCHISFDDIRSLESVIATQVEDHVLIALKNAQLLLQRGFTSLFSAASAKPRLDVAVRDAIRRGDFAGPRIRAAGQEISPTGNLGDADTSYLTLPRGVRFTIACDGPDEFTRAARLAARDGVDNLKVNVSGDRDWGHMHADDTVTVITEPELAALMDVANARKLMACAHCTSSQGIKMCLRQGVPVIYHAVHADTEARDMLEAAKDRVFVAPAVGLPWTMLHEHAAYGLEMPGEKLDTLARELETTADCMADLHRRGVRVLPGGDYGAFVTNPIGTNARDLEHFVSLFGLSPMEAIVAATRHGGALMQESDSLGVLKPGFLADLIVVDGDPLDDIRILQDPNKLSAVMVNGVFAKMGLAAIHGDGTGPPIMGRSS